jgi:hypothetical protein
MSELVEKARNLAHLAHAGQVDKAGRPYIEHVARVAAAVVDDPVAEAVAWLHDVLEDCPQFREEFWQFPADVTWRVGWLTRLPGQPPSLYYDRIRRDPIALRVKLADVADNSDRARLALLDTATASRLRAKYAQALAFLDPDTGQRRGA